MIDSITINTVKQIGNKPIIISNCILKDFTSIRTEIRHVFFVDLGIDI